MKIIQLLVTLLVGLFLQSCTVLHYRTNNELTMPLSQYEQAKKITYHVSITGQPIYETLTAEHSPETLERMRVSYCSLTQKVFDREGVSASSTTNKETANFLINVNATPYCSALPQEWLTGLTFGLIPSWGTRYNQCTYTFEKVGEKKAHSYQN